MVLPTERELAAKLGMGPPAIRESIKALTILDVLESRRGDGTYVKPLEGRRKEWPTKLDVSTKDFSVLDLLEVRKMIEPKAPIGKPPPSMICSCKQPLSKRRETRY